MAVPEAKNDILSASEAQIEKIKEYFRRGLMTDDERYRKVVKIWEKATNDVGEAMKASMTKMNPLT